MEQRRSRIQLIHRSHKIAWGGVQCTVASHLHTGESR